MNDPYEIRRGIYSQIEDLDKLLDLLRVTYPSRAAKFSRDYKKWQYLENPNGEAVSFNAYDSNKLIAHYCAIPTKMMINGVVYKGLLSLDTATHPNYRHKGLFVTLADKTYEYARNQGYSFVIGVANANSTHGFLSKLGFYQVSQLDVMFGYGNVYNNVVLNEMSHIVYDEDVLDWRLHCPSFSYYIKGHAIVGRINSLPINTIMGCCGEYAKSILSWESLLKPNVYIGLGANLKTGLYFPMPKFIKRSPFNLIFKDLTEGDLPKLTKDNIFFQLLDFDVA